MTADPYRLPRNVVPSNYDLRFVPDTDAGTFAGELEAVVDVLQPTDRIVLNAVDIDFEDVSIEVAGEELPGTVELEPEMERAVITFGTELPTGPAALKIGFGGQLSDQLVGFYQSHYTDADGNDQVIATTQFESTDARRAFPGWDEPDLKATFQVTLDVAADLTAISNTAEISRTDLGDGKVRVQFAPTMKMSTYLVAMIVGPLEVSDPVDVDGVPLRIVYPTGKGHLIDFAKDCGAFSLRWLTEYYGIPYPGDKIDFIAIPDFAFGAMENVGAVTYREAALLIDPETATQAQLSRVADVIAHELAHMWFGNLVTMKWWDGIWLNEAFASFMEMKTADAYKPEWRRWLAFASDSGTDRNQAFEVDALSTSRPVEFEVNAPGESKEMFDPLTYGKGSAILRMLEQFIGEDAFRDGIRTYLAAHSYGNTVTRDLWKALGTATHQPIADIMDGFILQSGFPTVSVESSAGNSFTMSQQQFLYVGGGTHTWNVPVIVEWSAGGVVERRSVIVEDQMTITADGQLDWVVANAGGHGFYRVNYSEDLRSKVLGRLDQLSELERYVFLEDAWAQTVAGQMSAVDFLAVAERYRDDRSHAPWQLIVTSLATLKLTLDGEARDALADFAGVLLGPTASRLGWEAQPQESDLVRRLRGIMVRAMANLAENPEYQDRVDGMLDAALSEPGALDPDINNAVLFSAVARGDSETFERYLERFRSPADPQQERIVLAALAGFRDPSLGERNMDLIAEGTIRSQDGAVQMGRLLGNRYVATEVWDRIEREWDEIMPKLPSMIAQYVLHWLSDLVAHPETSKRVLAFLETHDVPSSSKRQPQQMEMLRVMLAMREQNESELGDYLLQR